MAEEKKDVRMYGPNEKGVVVNTSVHPDNVKAFEIAGWKRGEQEDAPEWSDVSEPDPEPEEEEQDSEEEAESGTAAKPKRGRKAKK